MRKLSSDFTKFTVAMAYERVELI